MSLARQPLPEATEVATSMHLLRKAAVTLAWIGATVLVAYLAATFVRQGLIERDDLGSLCQSRDAPWWCTLRLLVIRAFLNQAFSAASLALALLAAWRRSAWAAHLAIAIGVAGMVLYDYKWSVVGVLAGALVVARLQGQWQEHAEPQHHG